MATKKITIKRFFKIRHKKTGLYSCGGSYASHDGRYGGGWTPSGKIWQGMGPLKNHLAQYLPPSTTSSYARETFNKNIGPILENWEIVEIEMVAKDIIPMTDLYNDFEVIKRASK